MAHAFQILVLQPWVERLGWTLVHFLWQGVVIAALYAGARTRSAQVRYVLACAALATMMAAPVVTFSLTSTSESVQSNPFVGTVPLASTGAGVASPAAAVMPVMAAGDMMPWLVMAWFAGAIVFWARLMGGCIVAARMRSMFVRPASAEWQRKLDEIGGRVRVSRPVKLLTSALVQVPTVVGWLRPVVLMPVGALAGLPMEHVEALLAHELAHIRRHDYLVNILQSVAEALLFYHPAVWWISANIRDERELCCDDVAVAIGGDAFVYVRALAELESYRPAHFNPALAANGGSLPERIGRLLGIRPAPRAASGPVVIAAVGLVLLSAVVTLAQSIAPKPVFEVASIKPSPPENVGFQGYAKNGRYTALTATPKDLIAQAYGLRGFQISGGPAWFSSTNYNISAMYNPAATQDDVKIMVQGLLADRFSLKFHRITKKSAGYALIVDKNGPKLTRSKNPGPGLGGGKGSLNGRGADMPLLAKVLSSRLEAPVTDRTGLRPLYDFTVTWTPDEEAAESPGISMFTALREQLGLRLDAVKNVPVDILVVDRMEKPTEN